MRFRHTDKRCHGLCIKPSTNTIKVDKCKWLCVRFCSTVVLLSQQQLQISDDWSLRFYEQQLQLDGLKHQKTTKITLIVACVIFRQQILQFLFFFARSLAPDVNEEAGHHQLKTPSKIELRSNILFRKNINYLKEKKT